MSSFSCILFALFYLHTYSPCKCLILLYELRYHYLQEPFQDSLTLGQDPLQCVSFATPASPMRKFDLINYVSH